MTQRMWPVLGDIQEARHNWKVEQSYAQTPISAVIYIEKLEREVARLLREVKKLEKARYVD